jgi:hypothetical protein
MARQLYYATFHNMWSDNTIVNKLMTKLLQFLLIIHLCPDQDNGFKANKANKAKHQNKGKKSNEKGHQLQNTRGTYLFVTYDQEWKKKAIF